MVASPTSRPQVLLVDEVDVFFSESFYGASYTPMVPIEHPAFTAMVKDVWHEYTASTPRRPLRLADWQKRESFLSCLQALPQLGAQLQETLKDLLTDVTQISADPYTVSNGLIAYAENDGLTTDARFGYRTMFAALSEFDSQTITSDAADSYCRLNLQCGHFSFADLPLQFDFILGASGTLATLSEAEQNIVTNVYKLCAQTYIPSTFGSSNLKFLSERPLQMTSMDARHATLCTEISNRLISTDRAVKSPRAVIVFFESIEELNAFAVSPAFQSEPYGKTQCIVTEHIKLHEKEMHFNNATSPGNVALMTRSFGRGTDFLTHHPAMASNGGVHIICTFLPPSMAEETQIRGRTARQSDPGSFSLVLPVEKMELFQIDQALYDAKKKDPQLLYEYLDGARKKFYERQYKNRADVVQAAKKEHDAAMHFLADLRQGAARTNEILAFLLSRNLGPAMKRQSRTLLCFDATYSMQDLLAQTKLTIGDTFERAGEVLRQHGMDDQSFSLQLCAYRNYNVRDLVLENSAYDNRPHVLRDWLSRISIAGGMGPEALELALWHVANEVEAAVAAGDEAETQVIFVGDAPAQDMDEVRDKRAYIFGEPYWAASRFGAPTDWRAQLNRVIALKVPVHAFWLAARARSQFEEMARLGNGSCHQLDVSSPQSAAKLTDLLTMAVLQSVGGAANGDALVAAYKKTYRAHA